MEKKGNQDEKMLSTKIAWLLGKGSLKDFETVREAEVNDFRATIIGGCRTAIEKRNAFSWEAKVMYHYPPDIESSSEITQLVANRLSPQVLLSSCWNTVIDCLMLTTHSLRTRSQYLSTLQRRIRRTCVMYSQHYLMTRSHHCWRKLCDASTEQLVRTWQSLRTIS